MTMRSVTTACLSQSATRRGVWLPRRGVEERGLRSGALNSRAQTLPGSQIRRLQKADLEAVRYDREVPRFGICPILSLSMA